MKIKLLAFLFVIVIGLMCSSASATDGLHLQSSGQFYLQYNPIDLYDIDTLAFYSDGSTPISPNNYTFQNESGMIISNCTSVRPLYSGMFTNFSGNTLYFVNPADDRIDLDGGNWNVSGARLIGQGNIEIKEIPGGDIKDVYMDGIYQFYISSYNDGGVVNNIEMHNSYNGIYTYITGGLDNYIIENVSMTQNEKNIFRLQNSSNTTVRNVSVISDVDFNDYSDVLGLGAWYSDNVSFYDIYIDETQGSAFRANVVDHFYAENVSTNHAGHNGYDIAGHYISIINGKVNGSVSNSIHISTPTGSQYTYTPEVYNQNLTHDVLIKNILTTFNTVEIETGQSTGGGGVFFNNCYNVTIENVTSTQQGGGFTTTYSMDCNIFNCSVADNTDSDGDLYLGSGNAEADRAIRTTISNSDFPRTYIVNSEDTKFINVNGTKYISLGVDDYKEWTNYYALNVQVLNITSHPVSNATLTFECSNTSFTAVDMAGNEITSVTTGIDGKPTEIVYLPESYYDAVTTSLRTSQTFTNNVTATKSTESDSEIVDLDSSDYSANLSALSGDLVTIVLDVDGEGEPIPEDPLSISSSSPSGNTISMYNTSTLTTSITVNKEANISVYLDSVLVQTNTSVTTATYVNDSMTVGTPNITMLASVGGESVNRVWTITVSEYVAQSEEETTLKGTMLAILFTFFSSVGGIIILYLLYTHVLTDGKPDVADVMISVVIAGFYFMLMFVIAEVLL